MAYILLLDPRPSPSPAVKKISEEKNMDKIWCGVVTLVAGKGANTSINLFLWTSQPSQMKSTPQTQVKR